MSGLPDQRAKTKLVLCLSVALWLALAGLLLAAAPARADLVPPPNDSPSPRVTPYRHPANDGGSTGGTSTGTVVTWAAMGLAVVLLAAGSWLALRKIAASHAVREPAAQTPPVEGAAAQHPEPAGSEPPGEDER